MLLNHLIAISPLCLLISVLFYVYTPQAEEIHVVIRILSLSIVLFVIIGSIWALCFTRGTIGGQR